MNKSDLRTGMRVTTNNGDKFIVLLNSTQADQDIIARTSKGGGYMRLSDYDSDLRCITSKDFSIVKVELPSSAQYLFNGNIEWVKTFDAVTAKEMTVSDIEKALGYPVKIIKENA